MLVILPMSGYGERFRNQGYNVPKPLIEVEGKTFIQHVYEMFDPNDEFVFICNNDHLNNSEYRMREKILSFCSKGIILGINPHKLGPIHAVNEVILDFPEDKEVIINYCDFTCYWNYKEFKKFIKKSNSVGCIPAYKGFHPHSQGKTNYAYIKESNNIVSDIQEKKPFTLNKTNEYASSGTYYFRSVRLLKLAIEYVIKNDINVSGEYYVSMAYKYLFKENLKTTVYHLNHFMQWGTPQDFEEYKYYSDMFRGAIVSKKKSKGNGTLIVPMAGFGSRFQKEGFERSKPLIQVLDIPMIKLALNTIPEFENKIYVIRENMHDKKELHEVLFKAKENTQIIELTNQTNGQATTILEGVKSISTSNSQLPLHIVSCDNGYLFDQKKLIETDFQQTDVLVWAIKSYPFAKISPNSYGWVYYNQDQEVQKVSVKEKVESKFQNAVITGGFSFSNKEKFKKCYEALVNNNRKVNGEYYADSLIQEAIDLGLTCKVFLVESYISWGTPYELETYLYWQKCFNLWKSHPYSLEKDTLREFPSNYNR